MEQRSVGFGLVAEILSGVFGSCVRFLALLLDTVKGSWWWLKYLSCCPTPGRTQLTSHMSALTNVSPNDALLWEVNLRMKVLSVTLCLFLFQRTNACLETNHQFLTLLNVSAVFFFSVALDTKGSFISDTSMKKKS